MKKRKRICKRAPSEDNEFYFSQENLLTLNSNFGLFLQRFDHLPRSEPFSRLCILTTKSPESSPIKITCIFLSD